MQFSDIKAVVFDLDGTLVDTVADIAKAVNMTFSDYGLPQLTLAEVTDLVGKGAQILLQDCLNAVRHRLGSAKEPAVSELYAAFLLNYQRINGQQSQIYPGVDDCLKLLSSQGIKLACLTNKPLQLAQQLLVKLLLADFFAVIFGGDSFSVKKPNPLPLLNTCAALEVNPRQTLMVGDSINDLQAARGADCRCILVDYGYNCGLDVATMGADAVVSELAEITTQIIYT